MSEADSTKSDLEALKALQTDAQELQRLENLLDRFNVFETIGFIGQEVMHSRFLAFLLDPNQKHGLGDVVLRQMLEKASASSNATSMLKMFEDNVSRNMGQTGVQTEVYTDDGRIDILLLNEVGEWAMIIENKVWSTEHSNQLDRYYRFMKKTYPGWLVFGIYLTPHGDASSHEDYLSLGYETVCETLEAIVENRDSTVNDHVQMTVEHYTDMVRRNIVGNSCADSLAQEIYQKHQQALDFIYEHRFARQVSIRNTLLSILRDNPDDFIYTHRFTDYPTQEYIHFGLRRWDVPRLQTGSSSQEGNRSLLFGFGNWPDTVSVYLQIRPGDNPTRQRLLDLAHANPDVFEGAEASLSRWTGIFSKTFISPESYEGATESDRRRTIHQQWTAFLEEDLPRIDAALKAETWIWESTETEGPI